jgi:hypothetical protein
LILFYHSTFIFVVLWYNDKNRNTKMKGYGMTGRPFGEMQKIRKWIEAALSSGEDSPTSVLEWIEQKKNKDTESPSLATIGRIMRDMGYAPTGIKWEKKGGE